MTAQLTEFFEGQRPRLRAVAYRMLGSLTEADDAVQEAWLRLARTDTTEIDNLAGWLTTVVSRVCLDMLRARRLRREEPLPDRLPDPVVRLVDTPETEAVVADSVGLALLVVLDRLTPAERIAFVLHDMFGLSFDEIAPIVGRTTGATTQLASRARRRVRGSAEPDGDRTEQRAVVDAFLAAARDGDLRGLIAALDPDVLLRADTGRRPTEVRGAEAVARQAMLFADPTRTSLPAIVNGDVGIVAVKNGRPLAVLSYTIHAARITEINILADPDRLAALDLPLP
jgi:RNA polymerase sigma-70 factor, ECF subfamily